MVTVRRERCGNCTKKNGIEFSQGKKKEGMSFVDMSALV